MKTHKQRLLQAMMSDKVVSQKKFPSIQVRTRITELRKQGYVIECLKVESAKGTQFIYELNYKKTPKKLFK
jgi:exosome complex RNA-binding protein Csl4